MRKVIACFMIISLSYAVYAESGKPVPELPGFILDKLLFEKEKTKQAEKDDQPDKKNKDKSVPKLPKSETKLRANPKMEIPKSKIVQKKTLTQANPVVKQSLQRVFPFPELSTHAGDYILIQKQIALQQKKNELAQLEQQLLKIQCEKEKIKLEIDGLKNPDVEAKTSKPTYVSGSMGINQGQSFFRALMVSSVDGMRAFVIDNGVTHHVHKGEKVSRGTVVDITSEGLYLDEEGKQVFYPVSH